LQEKIVGSPTKDIDVLIDKYLTLSESPENRRRLALWEPEFCARDQWHGRPIAGEFRRRGTVPLTVDFQNPFWLQLFPTNLVATYDEPAAYLRFYLQRRIYAFEHIPDDTPLDGAVQIYLGTPFESSIFGVPVHYFPDRDPIIDQMPIIHDAADLDRLCKVKLFESGMMPQARKLYEGMVALAGGRLQIRFPEWLRGPFGVALYLRGYQEFMVDLVAQPAFAHTLLDLITQARMDWFQARATYLGQPVPTGSLFNDEIDASVIGRRHYREHIRPYEARLATFHKAISYWHSCGNIGPIASEIVSLGCVEMLDISGWTRLQEVLESLDRPAPRLEIRLHPVRELQDATPARMAQTVREVLETAQRYDVGAFTLRVSGLQPHRGLAEDLAQVRLWLETARREIENWAIHA